MTMSSCKSSLGKLSDRFVADISESVTEYPLSVVYYNENHVKQGGGLVNGSVLQPLRSRSQSADSVRKFWRLGHDLFRSAH